jgi:hypothetical protein
LRYVLPERKVQPHYIAADLEAAVHWILKEEGAVE